MKSTVKHYKLINGKLTFVGNEVHEYSLAECPLQPENQIVLSERRVDGRRTVVLSESPKQRGRPVDELKANLLGSYITEDIERMIGEMQYHGTLNEDDENPLDLSEEEELREICDPGRERAVFAQTNRIAIPREGDRR